MGCSYQHEEKGDLIALFCVHSAWGSCGLFLWSFFVDCAAGLEWSQSHTALPLLRVKYSAHEPARQHREQRLFSLSVARLNHLRIQSPPLTHSPLLPSPLAHSLTEWMRVLTPPTPLLLLAHSITVNALTDNV